MSFDSLPRAVVCLLAAYLCFYGTGHGILGRSPSALPHAFRRVLLSTIVTTLVGTALAAGERFSLTALLSCNSAIALAGVLLRRRRGASAGVPGPAAAPDFAGPLIVLISLLIYWPAYPTFLGASDSTAYIATGVSLAHHGALARDDELGPQVPAKQRAVLFDSMSQVFGSTGPPYRRMPGGMLIDSLESTKVWPAFFPVPSVWAAVFVSARAPGGPDPEQAAPGYAPVFAALALWAFWLLAREWLGSGYALIAVALLGMSGPFYASARMPLSESIAAFFSLSGLAALTAGARRRERPHTPATAASDGATFDSATSDIATSDIATSDIATSDSAAQAHSAASRWLPAGGAFYGRGDAMLAGAALGAAVFTRVETALLLVLALALQPSLAPRRDRSGAALHDTAEDRLPAAFLATLLLVASLTIVQAATVPGTWISPLLDHYHNARIRLLLAYGLPSMQLTAAIAAGALAILALGARRVGWSAVLRWSVILSIVFGQAAASRFLAARTPMWLSFAVGWSGLTLAAIGGVLAWRDRARLPAAALVLSVAASVAVILFYNPHVYPSLPWGWRRFVPLLLPLIVLLACYTAARAGSRSRLLSLACLALLAVPVVAGGRPAWGRLFAEGSYETLQRLSDAIPRDGTILLDREISKLMAGPALWLVHDRNAVTVPPTGGYAGRVNIPPLVWSFTEKGPVYFVTRALGTQTRIPKVRMTVVSSVAVNLPFLEQTYDRRPEKIQRYLMPLTIYRLERSLDPRGDPLP